MKCWCIPVILAASLTVGVAWGQQMPELPGQPHGYDNMPDAAPPLPPLKENVTLEIKGSILADVPVDLTWTGVGPQFNVSTARMVSGQTAEPAVPDPGRAILNVWTGEISATADGYRVKCAIQTRAPRFDVYGNHTYVSYQQVPTEVTVLLKPRQPVTVFSEGSQKLTLTLTQGTTDYAAQQAPVSTAEPPLLDSNTKVTFSGIGLDGAPLEVTFNTVGGVFRGDVERQGIEVNGHAQPLFVECAGALMASGDGYVLEYATSFNMPMLVAKGQSENGNVTSASYTFQGVSENSTVALKPGQPVTVFQLEGNPLIVQVTKAGSP